MEAEATMKCSPRAGLSSLAEAQMAFYRNRKEEASPQFGDSAR